MAGASGTETSAAQLQASAWGWVAVPASSLRLGHTNKFDGTRLLSRFGLPANTETYFKP